MLGDLALSRSVVVPADELHWRFSRSSGPGGQSVNTADSRVELSYDVAASDALPPHLKARALDRLGGRLVDGVLTISASEQRSQWRNRQAALARLGALLREAIAPPPPPRRPTRPSATARAARVEGKRRRGQVKRLRQAPGDD